jgi:hypothetical protein
MSDIEAASRALSHAMWCHDAWECDPSYGLPDQQSTYTSLAQKPVHWIPEHDIYNLALFLSFPMHLKMNDVLRS